MNFEKLLVEYLGTFFFMFIILYTGKWYLIGATLAILAFIGGPISGGSYNPAVTLALVYANKLAKNKAIPYIIVEVLGALSAVFVMSKL